MRDYELVIVVPPYKSDNMTDVLNPYIEFITNHKGQILKVENWGKRALAYPINRLVKAHYVLLAFSLDGNKLSLLNDMLRQDSSLLRFMVSLSDKSIEHQSTLSQEAQTLQLIEELNLTHLLT